MDNIKNNSAVTVPIAETPHKPKTAHSISSSRKIKITIPSITISSIGVEFNQVADMDNFLPDIEMKSIEYLHSKELHKREISNRIKQMRQGSYNTNLNNKGLIFWRHIQDQQNALQQMGESFKKNPTEVVVNMERGGTILYDFLEPYISESVRPRIVITTEKELSRRSTEHIKKMVREIQHLAKIGCKSFTIVEVSISGIQLLKIIKTIIKTFDGDIPNIQLLILKQSLGSREDPEGKRIYEKIEKKVELKHKLNLQIFTTPFLIGEDVPVHLYYGSQNQHPINLIFPDESIWQCKSSLGARETLKTVMSGQVNSSISALHAT